MQIFIRTDPFNANAPQKSLSGSANFPQPTSDARAITGTATRILERIWRAGYAWKKAGILLLDLSAKGSAPPSLFDAIASPDDGLMTAMDQINAKYGRGSVKLGLAGKDRDWSMRRENLSPSFTTKWADLVSVRVG